MVQVRCYDVLEHLLLKRQGVASETRQTGRLGWAERARNGVYASLPPEERPFAWPRFGEGAGPGEDLAPVVAALRRARAEFAKAAAVQR